MGQALFSVWAVGLFCGCSPLRPSVPPKNTLTIALSAEPRSLDPRKAVSANGMRLVGLLFHGLVKIGPGLKIQGDGAVSWSQNGRKYSFILKPLTFSNGRPVTKGDILFSFREFQKKTGPFYSAFKNIKSVQVQRKGKSLKVFLSLKNPSAVFLSADLPLLKILPKKEALKEDFHKNPIGTGPFKLKERTDRAVILERRDHHRAPQFPRYLSFLIIRDSLTRMQTILAGGIDIAPSVISPEKIFLFEKRGFQIFSAPGLSVTYLLLNLKNPLLKNRRVREALSLAVNRGDMIKYKLKGYGVSAVTLIHPKNFFFNKKIPVPVFSPSRAGRILKDLKLKNSRLTLSCSNNQKARDQARILISQFHQAGFQVSMETAEWGVFYEDLTRGQFDMALLQWVGVVDPDIYYMAFHSDNQAPRGRNRSFYSNPVLDRLLERGRGEMDLQKRKEIYNRAQSLVSEDRVIIPLWHEKEIAIVKKGVGNYIFPETGDFSSLAQAVKSP